jgi:hypothetical protein
MAGEREERSCEFLFDLNLSVEVWFGKKGDLSVAVLQDGANEVACRHFTWEELLDDLDYEEPVERLREAAKLEVVNHKKAILKRMSQFVKATGFRLSGQKEKRITFRTQKPQMLRVINGALKSCIDAHGPITADTISSASKRIVQQLAVVEGKQGDV